MNVQHPRCEPAPRPSTAVPLREAISRTEDEQDGDLVREYCIPVPSSRPYKGECTGLRHCAVVEGEGARDERGGHRGLAQSKAHSLGGARGTGVDGSRRENIALRRRGRANPFSSTPWVAMNNLRYGEGCLHQKDVLQHRAEVPQPLP